VPDPSPPPDGPPLRVGVSACLLGQEVRYDGGHKRDRWLTEVLGKWATFVPVCPEVEIGLGIPRPTIRLERGADGGVRLVEPRGGEDLTARMEAYAARRVAALRREDLDGYVLKKNSPSCGRERVRVHGPRGGARRDGTGLFAAALREGLPLLPVEEEGRLEDPRLRENFVERLFAMRRLRALFRPRWTVGDLVRFHTAEKLLLLAHGAGGYRALGRLVAGAKGAPRAEVEERYRGTYLATLARPATTRRHTNVLQHMAGHLRGVAGDDERAEVAEAIEEFRLGRVPLVVPLALLRHHVRRHGIAWLAGQHYLEPHPREMMLRNRV
jgi:uncharacterized protein YbgA (DUF1722 family)/uncharacterized protein YbbK (DUF523 family)